MAATLLVFLAVAVLYVACYRRVRQATELRRPEETAGNRPARDVAPARLDLGRLLRDMATAWALPSPPGSSPEPPLAVREPLADPAEAREAALSSQLLEGALDSATYRSQMSELAHDGKQPHGRR